MSDYQYTEYRRPLWPALVAFGTVGGLSVALGLAAYFASGAANPAERTRRGGATVQAPAAPEAHQLARKYILLMSGVTHIDPRAIEFTDFGPDALDGKLCAECAAIILAVESKPHVGPAPEVKDKLVGFIGRGDQAVRVLGNVKAGLRPTLAPLDMLVLFKNGEPMGFHQNKDGDKWIDKCREGVAAEAKAE